MATTSEVSEATQTNDPITQPSNLEKKSDSLLEASTPDGATIPSDDEEIEYPHGIKLVLILLSLCCAVFLLALDQTIIATAIPKIIDQFASIQDIGWYGSSYLLTTTALQPTFGRIYTTFSVG